MGNLESAVDELAAEDLSGLTGVERAERLLRIQQARNRLDAEWFRSLADFDRSGDWADDGALSVKAWLRRHCRIAPGAASEQVRVARRLDDQPRVRDAFESGDIGYEHVRQVSRVLAETSDRLAPEKQDEAEAMLIDVAREHDPAALRQVCEHFRHVVDAEGFRQSEIERFDRRRLSISPLMDGMEAIDGLADAEGAAILRTAIDSLSQPVPGDTRTPGQRRFDGLVDLARRALNGGELPATGGERPHVGVVVPLTTLEGRAGASAAELARSGQPISGEAARRLACDAKVSRSEPSGGGLRAPRRAPIGRPPPKAGGGPSATLCRQFPASVSTAAGR